MIKLGSNSIGKIYFGSNSIGKAYLGSNLVFQKGSSPTPPGPTPVLTMLYENSEAITSWTDTGVKLFNPPIDWTILCDASCNNYNWRKECRTMKWLTPGIFTTHCQCITQRRSVLRFTHAIMEVFGGRLLFGIILPRRNLRRSLQIIPTFHYGTQPMSRTHHRM